MGGGGGGERRAMRYAFSAGAIQWWIGRHMFLNMVPRDGVYQSWMLVMSFISGNIFEGLRETLCQGFNHALARRTDVLECED